MIRKSTVTMMMTYHTGDTPLSSALNQSLSSDPISPVLPDQHLLALDRRLAVILDVVRDCVKNADKPEDVIIVRDEDYNNVKPDQDVDDGHFFS